MQSGCMHSLCLLLLPLLLLLLLLLLTRAARCALRRPNQRSCHISACLHRPLSLQQSRQAVICLLQRLGLRWVSGLGDWDTGSIQRSKLASKKEHIVAFSVGLGFFFFFFLFLFLFCQLPIARLVYPSLAGRSGRVDSHPILGSCLHYCCGSIDCTLVCVRRVSRIIDGVRDVDFWRGALKERTKLERKRARVNRKQRLNFPPHPQLQLQTNHLLCTPPGRNNSPSPSFPFEPPCLSRSLSVSLVRSLAPSSTQLSSSRLSLSLALPLSCYLLLLRLFLSSLFALISLCR
ncbi:hypothetical protein BO82DRAFT_23012 [Aspergillus uvarum CBS 121591]|uniref:Uncharacterized protein n=1 Tax=Aspergillus uvarum CBS 121591 TaxID=1448315 RepID=A0A319CZD6_9EURO|nr:hypothetical protein BO82DRAFT_23012 [Aspergillus uvarum CBS 121591]PYH84143.1 hypothetical protein BO82DRAFT_23012 [Aspergillus uvarum CBS 121591]